MKFGVLTFGYDTFATFAVKLQNEGSYSVNLGDNSQSIAIHAIYRHLGIPNDEIVRVNRDAIPQYSGEPILLIMNAVFPSDSFPLPESIVPIFIGFHAAAEVIAQQRDLLARYAPIGCRDDVTTTFVREIGIEAFTSGCLTLSLPQRAALPATPKLLVVYGSYAGTMPSRVLRHIPPALADTADFIFHRLPVATLPLSEQQCSDAQRYEESLLERYRTQASLVLTPLHHVATPCMAMGVPVIIARDRNDSRFSFIDKLTPVYLPENFERIDWNPGPVDLSTIRAEQIRATSAKIIAALSRAQ